MDENKPSADVDDAEILAKFRNLLNKYQHQDKPINATNNTTVSPATVALSADGILREAESDKIPVLTEVVMLHPSVIQSQPKRLTSMRQILDAALEDTYIEMDIIDRKALANALEVRLANQLK